MSIWKDLRVLYQLNLASIRGATHAERLENFYAPQAIMYDAYRERLLQGREELWKSIEFPADGIWVDLGGGTGSNFEYLGDRIGELKRAYIVDLSPSLLDVARHRIEAARWTNVDIIQADALRFQLPEPADVVTFSYSLTMIPDWIAVIEYAMAMLQPRGQIGIVDFYHSRKFPADGMKQHSWLTRTFWSLLVSRDNVFLSPDHLPFLQSRFETTYLREGMAKVPYILWMRIPFYIFVGRLRGSSVSTPQ